MAVKVSFIRPKGIGAIEAPAIGSCRVCETIAVPGTTTAAALDGEIAVIVSTEATAVIAAHGSAPDAAATASTVATSAGYGIPPGQTVPVVLSAGDKISIKAFA